MSGATPFSVEGIRGVAGGLRLRIRPLQLALLIGVTLVIGIPLLAGSDRRSAMHKYISTASLGGHRHSPELSAHIPPPSGGIPDEEDIPLTLEARLKYLLQRPALDQWEAELPNRYNCPMFTFARNTYFFHDGKDEEWKKVSKDDVRRYRQKMVDYFRSLDREGKKIIWDKSMEASTPVDQRRGLIYTGGEGVSRCPGLLTSENVRAPTNFVVHAAQRYQVDSSS